MSESNDESNCNSKEDTMKPSSIHSTLAMKIKEQSLARSSPGDHGPYKCSKCKRLYRLDIQYFYSF